jgi:hypothetical protein
MSAVFFGLLGAEPSHAYILATPKDQPELDYNKPTRILVAGRGTDLALLPQMTALSRAAVYLRNFPDEQIVLISVLENRSNKRLLASAGWVLMVDNKVTLETKTVVEEAKKFAAIRSFELFAHSSATRGFQMDGTSHEAIRFEPFLASESFNPEIPNPEVESLKDHFAPGAYAILSGCNSGWAQAQKLAKMWNIAVAGTFTESQFELLHSDGHFYVGETKFAPNRNWAKRNSILDSDCSLYGCTRMRPNNKSYAGWWGQFDGDFVAHFKFFCPLSVHECQKRMALSLYGFLAEKPLRPDSTLEEFSTAAKEYLCPLSKDRRITKKCFDGLAQLETDKNKVWPGADLGDRTVYYNEQGGQLVCTLHGCRARIECDVRDKKHHCVVSDRVSKNSRTLAWEYWHLINGFRSLAEEGI